MNFNLNSKFNHICIGACFLLTLWKFRDRIPVHISFSHPLVCQNSKISQKSSKDRIFPNISQDRSCKCAIKALILTNRTAQKLHKLNLYRGGGGSIWGATLVLILGNIKKKAQTYLYLKVKWHGMAKTLICQNFTAKIKND